MVPRTRTSCPPVLSTGSPSSPSSWRALSLTPRRAETATGSLTSRPPCVGWRHSWRRLPSPSAVFASVAEEVGRLLAVDAAAVRRYHAGRHWRNPRLSGARRGEVIPVGLRAQPVAGTVTAIVRETRRPARVDRYTDEAGGAAREIGIRSSVGVPITVEGELWGLIAVVSTIEEPPPPGTEERLAGFTELVATAIANAQAREELRTIAGRAGRPRACGHPRRAGRTAGGGVRGGRRASRPPAQHR